MIVIKKEPWCAPEVIEIENELSALQNAVGGYIEIVPAFGGAVVVCNEEGRLMGLPYNCHVCGIPFVGTILITGTDGEDLADIPDGILDTLRGW